MLLSKIWIGILLAILSGVFLALAYPLFNLEFLAWFAFVPLFFAIRNKNLKQAFFISYICGLVFFAITIYWLIHVTLLGLILLVLYLALYFGIFGVCFRLLTVNRTLLTFVVPSSWIALEYLRSRLLTGFPWALLGYSQYLNLPIIQIADITGVWGVSFLVMMVNVAVYTVIARRPEGPTKQSPNRLLRSCFASLAVARNDAATILLPFLLLCLSLGYGFYKLHKLPITNYKLPITISLIQGNIPQHQKWDEGFREFIMQRYETLTKEAAKDKPDLIIWPETAVPGVIGEEPELLARVLRLAKGVRTPLLIGTVTAQTSNQRPAISDYHNSAILISKEGKILEQYDKLHLVPFGEYVPFERYFSFLRELINVPIGDFTAGKEYTIFKLKTQNAKLKTTTQNSKLETGFGVLICFEDIFPELPKRFVKEGADFLINITNDAWFMRSSAPYQHCQASVFRAVENRVPVVRAANTGLSCFVDSTGRIYDKVKVGKEDIFVIGYKTAEIAY